MIDGRTYYSFDNWQTVWLSRGGYRSRVTDRKEADLARFLAASQASASPNWKRP